MIPISRCVGHLRPRLTMPILIRHFVDIPSSVTDNVFAFHSAARIDDGASLGTFWHYTAVQSALPAGAALATQVGFYAGGNLIDAGTNYGFSSDIPAGPARWNYYAGGTAPNFFAGTTYWKNATNSSPTVTGFTVSNDNDGGYTRSSRNTTGETKHAIFYNPNGEVGSIKTSGNLTIFEESSDYPERKHRSADWRC